MLKLLDRYPQEPRVQVSLLLSCGWIPRSVAITSHSCQVAETDTSHRLSPEASLQRPGLGACNPDVSSAGPVGLTSSQLGMVTGKVKATKGQRGMLIESLAVG